MTSKLLHVRFEALKLALGSTRDEYTWINLISQTNLTFDEETSLLERPISSLWAILPRHEDAPTRPARLHPDTPIPSRSPFIQYVCSVEQDVHNNFNCYRIRVLYAMRNRVVIQLRAAILRVLDEIHVRDTLSRTASGVTHFTNCLDYGRFIREGEMLVLADQANPLMLNEPRYLQFSTLSRPVLLRTLEKWPGMLDHMDSHYLDHLLPSTNHVIRVTDTEIFPYDDADARHLVTLLQSYNSTWSEFIGE